MQIFPTALETARSLANGPSWWVGGGVREKYVFCDPLELRRLVTLFCLERSLWESLNGWENYSLHWNSNMLPLFSIMTLWGKLFQKCCMPRCIVATYRRLHLRSITNDVRMLRLGGVELWWAVLTILAQDPHQFVRELRILLVCELCSELSCQLYSQHRVGNCFVAIRNIV